MKSLSNDPKLGIDIGRVIISRGQEGDSSDTSFIQGDLDAALRTPPETDAFEVIKELVELFGDGNVWLVSKCGKRIQERTKSWLAHHDFWAKTGVWLTHIRFCKRRHEKAPIAKELGLTHFIDDRGDCLFPMKGIVPHRFLFGPQRFEPRDNVSRVLTWEDVRLKLPVTFKWCKESA